MNFGSKFLARHAQHLFRAAHIALDFTYVYCTAAGTIFGTTDVYELDFYYLSISIFKILKVISEMVVGYPFLHLHFLIQALKIDEKFKVMATVCHLCYPFL